MKPIVPSMVCRLVGLIVVMVRDFFFGFDVLFESDVSHCLSLGVFECPTWIPRQVLVKLAFPVESLTERFYGSWYVAVKDSNFLLVEST